MPCPPKVGRRVVDDLSARPGTIAARAPDDSSRREREVRGGWSRRPPRAARPGPALTATDEPGHDPEGEAARGNPPADHTGDGWRRDSSHGPGNRPFPPSPENGL